MLGPVICYRQAMRAQLEIVWDGVAPGLAEHELSVSALNQSLYLLLVAVRRIRTNKLIGAVGDSERGGRGGRLARGSEQIDLRIRTLGHGCLNLGVDVFFPEDLQGSIFRPSEIEETMSELVDALSAESRGEHRNLAVRKYLRSLKGVSSHSYTARVGGRIYRTEVLGTPTLPPDTDQYPYLKEVVGEISGVLFPPANPEIRLSLPDGANLRLSATSSQVEQALELRCTQVIVRIMHRGREKPRLLSLRPADGEQKPALSMEEVGAFVLKRWRDTLERLGQ